MVGRTLWYVLRLMAFSLVLLSAAWGSGQKAAIKTHWIRIPTNSPLVVVNDVGDIASDRATTGQTVNFRTAQPLTVKNTVLVKAGAPVTGTVVYARGSGVGFGGQLLLAVDQVQAVDGSWIPLRMTPTRSTGADAVFPANLIDQAPATFPNGRNKVLRGGRNFYAFVDGAPVFRIDNKGITEVAPARPKVARDEVPVRVLHGTRLQVHPLQDISSALVATGSTIDFVVAAPVVVDQRTVIALQAPAKGTVLLSIPKGMAGGAGSLVVSVDAVQAVDGRWLRVRSTSGHRGAKNTELRAGLAILIPGGGLIPGKEAVIPASQEFTVSIFENAWVVVRKSPG